MAEIHLTVVTPENTLYEGKAEAVVVQGSEGELGILPDHAPLASRLGIGVLKIKKGRDFQTIALTSGGFLEVLPTQVTVMADNAEHPEEKASSPTDTEANISHDR